MRRGCGGWAQRLRDAWSNGYAAAKQPRGMENVRRNRTNEESTESQTLEALRERYTGLINHTLPGTFTQPVRFNHCFARIVLDWLYQDCWYNHLDKTKPAYKQLTPQQLSIAIERMDAWLREPSLLETDNNTSLAYRRKR